MKRIAIALVVLLMATGFSYATDIGFMAGLNLANLTGDLENTATLATFGGGAFATFKPAPQVFVRPQVLYMMKGTKADTDEFDEKIKLDYIEIPVLVGYSFPVQGAVSPSVFVGPAVSILTSAKYEFEGEEEDLKDVTKSIDFGAVFGGGVDVKTGEKGKVIFDIRYTLGLVNANDDVDSDEFSIKNGVLSFFLGYGFPVGP